MYSSANVTNAVPGTGDQITQTLTSTNGINVGTVVYQVTASSGICIGSVTNVTVTVNPDVIVDSGGDQVVCEGSALSLGGSITGGTTNGTWSTAGDGTFDDTGTNNGIFGTATLYSPGPGDISTGDVAITLTANDVDDPGGPCPVRSEVFTLTINPIALVTVIPDFSVCEPAVFSVSGTIGGGATIGGWSIITGNGSLSASSISGGTVGSNYSPHVSDVNTVVVLRLTALDPDGPAGPCGDVFEELSIMIHESAKVFASNDQEICEDVSATLNATITGSVATGSWSIVGSSGDGTFGDANSR